jgi:citrate lyase subunit beta-like protein
MISSSKPKDIPRGSLLYGESILPRISPVPNPQLFTVPASSPKFLKSSLSSPSQTITYDLEDSVHASAKASARKALIDWLEQIPSEGIQGRGLNGLSLAVRPNSPFLAPEAEDDAESGKEKVYETLRDKSEAGRNEDNVGMQDVMKVWGSSGARRLNEGAGPMMLLPKACARLLLIDL